MAERVLTHCLKGSTRLHNLKTSCQGPAMKIEEQALTRDQLFSLRDYHSKAADDGLGRIILAILAGAGSGLIFLANSPIVASGSGFRSLGLVASAALLIGIVTSFMALLSSRNHHMVERLGYSLRIQKDDFDRDFAPHLDEQTAQSLRSSQNENLNNFHTFRERSEDHAQRLVRAAVATTFIGIVMLVGIYWCAPPLSPNRTAAASPMTTAERPAPANRNGPR